MIRVATIAGSAPARMPTRVAAPIPTSTALIGKGGASTSPAFSNCSMMIGSRSSATASVTPMAPAITVATTDSIITPTKMRAPVAP